MEIQQNRMQSPGLNFYSRYNRVKDPHQIASLYSLLSSSLPQPPSELSLSALSSNNDSPIKQFGEQGIHIQRIEQVSKMAEQQIRQQDQQQKDKKMRQIQEKLQRLQRLEKVFQQSLLNGRKSNRKQDRHNFHLSEHNHNDHEFIHLQESPELSSTPAPLQSIPHIELAPPQIPKKWSTLQQHPSEQYVESVEQSEVNSSSVVIERLMRKEQGVTGLQFGRDPQEGAKAKDNSNRNLYEVELTHSQSQNIINTKRSHRGSEDKEKDLMETPRQENQTPPSAEDNQSKEPSILPMLDDPTDPPSSQKKRKTSDYQEFKEQILDKVDDIESEQYLPRSPQYHSHNINHFLSQIHQKKNLHDAKEQKSITDDLDCHPFEIDSGRSPEKEKDKAQERMSVQPLKPSFKKLMLTNRRQLNPRLVTSTILNVNEHLQNEPPQHRIPNFASSSSRIKKAQPSDKEGEGPPNKVNFKKIIKQSNKQVEKKEPTYFGANNNGANKMLLQAFFDVN